MGMFWNGRTSYSIRDRKLIVRECQLGPSEFDLLSGYLFGAVKSITPVILVALP